MTKQQIEWAKQHDWFVTDDPFLNGVWVQEVMRAPDGSYQTSPKHFTDFSALRIWAGY